MALREVLASFGVQVDDSGIKKLESGLSSAIGAIKKVAGALAVGFAGNAAYGWVKGQIDFADALQTTADKLGVGVEELQEFQYAADILDVSTETANQGIKLLNKTIGEASMGSKTAAEVFRQMGVSIMDANGEVRPSLDVLADVADSFQGLESGAQRTALAMKVFGKSGAEMIPMLAAGGAEIRRLQEQSRELGFVFGKEYSDAVNEADIASKQLDYAMRGVRIQIAAFLIPKLTVLLQYATKLAARFTKFAKETQFLQRALRLLAISGVGLLALQFAKLVRQTGGVGSAIAKALSLPPQALIAAALVVAIYLAFDDLMTLLDGGDSVIGRALESFLGAEEAAKLVEELRDSWKGLNEAVVEVMPELKELGGVVLKGLVAGLSAAAVQFAGVLRMAAGFVQLLTNSVALLRNVLQLQKAVFTGGDIQGALDQAGSEKSQEAAGGFMSGLGSVLKGAQTYAKGAQGGMSRMFGSGSDPLAVPALGAAGGAAGAAGWNIAPPTKVEQRNQVSVTVNQAAGEDLEGATRRGLKMGFEDQLTDTRNALGRP